MFGKKWKAFLAAGALAAAMVVTGCGGSGSAGSAAGSAGSQVIRVGAETTYPPFEFTQDDKYVGFDIDLSEAIIKQMGGQMEFKSMGFDALIPALQSGQIDMVASGMDVTPEREKQVSFSDVYFDQSGKVVIVAKDNDQIHDWNDLSGKVVGGQVGTTQVQMAQDAGANQVKQFDSNSQAFMELRAKTVDAVVIDAPIGMYYLKQGGDKDMKIVGAPKGNAGFAIAIKKDNKELLEKVNKALKEIKANGTYDKIYDKWFGASGK